MSAVDTTLVGAFDRQADRTPDAVAVVAAGVRMTYRALRDRADDLARVLTGLGVGAETVVPLRMARSADLVVAILAVLKAGGAYLPVHTGYPPARTRAVLATTDSPVLLVDQAFTGSAPPDPRCRVLDVTRAGPPPAVALPPVHPDQVAYVMFTSGSTGEPKGIAITHRAVVDLATDPCWAMRPTDRVLLHSPHAFDASTWEIWGPLLAGGRVVVAPPDTSAAVDLHRLITTHGVNRLSLTAGLFRVIAEDWTEVLAGLSEVTTGGDVISPAAVTRVVAHCPDITVRTTYGPTETTLCVTEQAWRHGDRPGTTVPLGNPMRGTRLYVLDDRLREAGTGVAGELWVAGTGLARGYQGRPGLTASRFVACPFGPPGARMYRTGDLVRRDSAGDLEFLGRGDDQLKVRGFRVEPGEIEAVLAACPGVRHAVVTAHGSASGDKHLVAYYVGTTDPTALRGRLAARLPDYLVPADIVRLPELPITPNGKVDWQALPAPAPPGHARLDLLCRIFAEVLELPHVGPDESFFDLGGHPLLAPRLAARLRSVVRTEADLRTLRDNPTPALLAKHLR